MPIIDGEKYACQSCIKGHRVSGCNHTDRELHHINPKGRPVKQCEHCRGARKAKSHHAKCECGERKDKHKEKGEAKVHDDSCGCHSGAKCMCGVKKEAVVELSKQSLHDVRARPKVTATHSESNLTVFANGHHRPCHRNNNTAHQSGAPYKLPVSRPHTLHSDAFANLMRSTSYSQPEPPVQRSMDTLALSNRDFSTWLGASSRNDSLPLTPISGSLDASNFQASLYASRNNTFPQGTCSPTEGHLSDAMGASQWPWSDTLSTVDRNFGFGSLSTSPSQECLPNLDNEWALGLSHPTWSAGDLPLATSNLADSAVQPISHSGESKHSAPELSTSSSPSEIGEAGLYPDFAPPSAVSETLFWEDKLPMYCPTTASAPSLAASETPGLDLDLSKTLDTVTAMTATSGVDLYADPVAMTMPSTTDDVAAPTGNWMLEQSNLAAFSGYDNFDMPASTFPTWI